MPKPKKENKKLETMRHSASHVLAMAVLKLRPKAKPAIGPAIEDGFYYDFEFKKPLSEEELPEIEKEMKKIIKEGIPFEKKELSKKEAKKLYKDNPYKLEILEELEEENISFYKSGNFLDLCRGPHVEKTSDIGAVALLSLAGAYWRGDEKNPQLTRIYGTAFPTKKELDEHLKMLEEAREKDHRKVGQELGLFTFSSLVGKGLPLFTEKGAAIWREIERFVVDEEIQRGYSHVRTPNIAKTDLYEKSGHYPYYKDTMYPPMEIDDEELILRPMTCPHHFELYKSKPRSYKELPLRLAEMATLYRYEKSGELSGLIRVREFTLSDSHNFVRKSQAEEEVEEVLDLIEHVVGKLGLEKGVDYSYRLSLGDRKNKEKYYDAPKSWEEGEKLLKKVLKERNAPYVEAQDEAAFYGPKIDIQMKNVSGKEETAFTVQYDFCLPERFNLSYTNEKGEEEQPVVIHRSSVGAMERTIAFLIEHFGGAFPVWLSPVQAVVIPVSEKSNEYAQRVEGRLKERGIRVEIDIRDSTMQAKIREAQLQKVPYMLIVGGEEEKENTVSVRLRDERDLRAKKLEDVMAKIEELYRGRGLELW